MRRDGAGILRGNAMSLPLADESVDLIVTSPPYFALRSYRDDGEHYDGQVGSENTPADFLRALWVVLDECWRVLKPSGSCWVNLGDKYAGSGGHNNGAYGVSGLHKDRPASPTMDAGIAARSTLRNAPDCYNQSADVLPKSVMGLPWRFALGASCPDPYRTVYEPGEHPQWVNRRPHVWHKPNGLPESVTDRCRANYEDWFHLTKQGRYFSAVDEIRELSEIVFTAPQNGTARHARAMAEGEGHHRYDIRTNNPLGKLPGSVWTIATEPLIVPDYLGLPDHFAAFPQEWPRRIILGWSPSGICVECGEGRRPVVDKTGGGPVGRAHRHIPGYEDPNGVGQRDMQYDITGYACACPKPTAPTRPSVVLDPFGGTGTVAGVARVLGRVGVSVDLSADYCRLAAWRVFRSGHFAKSIGRTDAERQNVLDFDTPPAVENAAEL